MTQLAYLTTGIKYCPKCEQDLPVDDFTLKGNTGARYSWCKKCTYVAANAWRKLQPSRRFTRYAWKTRLGVNWPTAEAMLEKQGYCCASCGDDISAPGTFHLDHNHVTGKVREFMCGHCNRMLGCAKDDPERLRKGAEYLERNA